MHVGPLSALNDLTALCARRSARTPSEDGAVNLATAFAARVQPQQVAELRDVLARGLREPDHPLGAQKVVGRPGLEPGTEGL
jgi:hypothetical protein